MARVLVVEQDPVFAALLEDRLHVARHEVRRREDLASMVSAASEDGVDLVILGFADSGERGPDLVRALRETPATRSLPILVLSPQMETRERVALLRAGADDFLAKPCDLEELMLRAERLLGTTLTPPALNGELESHSLFELIAYLEHIRESGVLLVRGRGGSGRVHLQHGLVVAARWEHLQGEEAVLAILGLKEGRFRLVVGAGEPDGSEESGFAAARLLLEAARIEDELARHSAHLPKTGSPLEACTEWLPTIDGNLEDLPIATLFEQVRTRPGTRLYDLLAGGFAAPQKVRLAVAWLKEKGAIDLQTDTIADQVPSTTEIVGSEVLAFNVYSLQMAAAQAGATMDTLPFLVLAEAGVWPAVEELFSTTPGAGHDKTFRELLAQLASRRGGDATYTTDLGTLTLHVQMLTPQAQPYIEALVSSAVGVLLWLDRGEALALARTVIQGLETASHLTAGVVVAGTPEARQVAPDLVAGTSRWKISRDGPKSLLGLLALLQPG